MDAKQMLDGLTELQAKRDFIRLQKEKVIKENVPEEALKLISDIEAEFDGYFEAIDRDKKKKKKQIKEVVIETGETISGEGFRANYCSGRVSWDTKGLEGWAVEHPEVYVFQKVGKPYVSIVKKG